MIPPEQEVTVTFGVYAAPTTNMYHSNEQFFRGGCLLSVDDGVYYVAYNERLVRVPNNSSIFAHLKRMDDLWTKFQQLMSKSLAESL